MSKKGANKLRSTSETSETPDDGDRKEDFLAPNTETDAQPRELEAGEAVGRPKGANKLRPSIGEQPAEVPASGKGANKLRTYSGETLPEESITAPVPTEFWRVASIQDKTQRRCPDWQVFIDGCWRCQPCNKMIDEQHVTTELHKTRLARWQEAQELESCGYKPPELPYLAYVPDEDGSRFLMCLLCRKSGKPKGTWVTDPASHSGTHEMPEGSKEHRRNLQNYPPDHPWYVENVTQARIEYHPMDREVANEPEPVSPQSNNEAEPFAAGDVAEPSTQKRNKLSDEYREVADDPATGGGSEAKTWLEVEEWRGNSCRAVPGITSDSRRRQLPPDWESARDSEGNTYYYHCKDRVPQWQFPMTS